MKPKRLCATCGGMIRLRVSDQRIPWHRDPRPRERKWCIKSPRYQPARPRAIVTVVPE